MCTRYLSAVQRELLAPESTGSAGASTEGASGDSHSQEDSTTVDSADPGQSRADTAPDDAADDDDIVAGDEDFADVPFNQHPRFKAVTTKLKKLARQNQRLRSVADRVKGVDLDTLRTRAAVAENLEQLFGRNPKLHKQVLEALSTGEPAAAAEPEFDPSKLPFDVNDDVGKFFVEQHKTILALQKQLGALTSSQTATARANYEQSWKSVTDAAMAALPENVRDVFQDAMYGAYRVAVAEGKRINPQTFVNSYLGRLKTKGLISDKSAQRSSAAAAQRIAESNNRLPRQPAGGGSPASSRSSKAETVSDVNRRLKQMWRTA